MHTVNERRRAMLRRTLTMAALVAAMLNTSCKTTQVEVRNAKANQVSVEALPPLEPLGYAGLYAGVADGLLLAAGGTNFPGEPVWKQGKKVWYDQIHVCDGKQWKVAGTLPRPMAMGAAVSIPQGVLVIGGGDEKNLFDDVFVLKHVNGKIEREDWPAFPKKIMASSAVLIGTRVFVVGGHDQMSPLANGPLADVWSLDLKDTAKKWRSEAPIPADGRWLPIVGTDGQSLFVISGFARKVNAENKPAIHCLSDVWKFTLNSTGGEWTRLADLPRANAAAPSPAPFVGGELMLLGGGVDDSNFGVPMDKRPPFPSTIIAVDVKTGQSRVIGAVKSSVVAAHTADFQKGTVVVSGEVKAGVRTPEVWRYRFD